MVQFRTSLKKYSHIFFEVDLTMLVFERNSREGITELFFRHNLESSINNPEDFIDIYNKSNLQLWDLYRR